MTGEHVWSTWIYKVLYPTGKRVAIFSRQTGRPIQSRRSTSIDVKPKIVCDQCNHGWLSDLENLYMKPLLTDVIESGTPKLFTEDDLVAIIAWAFKTAVVVDHMEHPRDPFFSPSQRERFSFDFTLPPGTQVYLFHYRDPQIPRTGSFASDYFIARKPLKGLKLYAMTFIVGQFGFQILSRHTPRRTVVPRILVPVDDFGRATIAIWPDAPASVSWPPPLQLSNDLVNPFSHRWRRLRVPTTT